MTDQARDKAVPLTIAVVRSDASTIHLSRRSFNEGGTLSCHAIAFSTRRSFSAGGSVGGSLIRTADQARPKLPSVKWASAYKAD
jgi:hypothetical protein